MRAMCDWKLEMHASRRFSVTHTLTSALTWRWRLDGSLAGRGASVADPWSCDPVQTAPFPATLRRSTMGTLHQRSTRTRRCIFRLSETPSQSFATPSLG